MNSSQFIRLSGVAALAAGGFGIVNAFTDGVSWIYYTGLFLTLIALVGIYLFQQESAGRLGLIGFLLAGGGVLLTIIAILPGLSEMVQALGMIILAVASLRAGSFPTWVPWMWIGAVIIGILGTFLLDIQSTLFLLSSIIFGLGLIGAGLSLWRSSQGFSHLAEQD